MKIAVAGATGRVGRHVVDVLREDGHEVVAMSRATGVDLITGEGLDEALTGVEAVIDVATGPSPEQEPATAFFVTASRNLQAAASRAGVQRIVVVSIIGLDHMTAGYSVAKLVHEKEMLAGPVPVRILHASQFHEFVEQMMQWGRQGDVVYLPNMRTQPIAARAVAEGLVELALDPSWVPAARAGEASILEIAGPREETVASLAALVVSRTGDTAKVETVANSSDPDAAAYESGVLLPGPAAKLAGPTFDSWLPS